jgi:hypothetical protein
MEALMDTLRFARLGLGLIGIFAAVQGVVAFPGLSGAAALVSNEFGSGTAVIAVLLPFLAVWVACYYLIFASRGLAQFLTGKVEALPEPMQSVGSGHVLIGLAGVLIVAYSLPGVITSVRAVLELGQYSAEQEFWRISIAYLAQMALGLLLVFRTDVLLRLWGGAAGEGSSGSDSLPTDHSV